MEEQTTNSVTSEFYDNEFDVDLSDVLGEAGDGADQPLDEAEASGAAGEAAEAAEPATDGSDGETEGEADQPEPEAEPEKFHLKWMDEQKDVSREEVIALAQKGLDYDRQRGKAEAAQAELAKYKGFHDENADAVEDLRAFMEENKLESIGDALDALRVLKLTQNGINRDVALERVKRGRAERALAKTTNAARAKQTEAEKMQEKVQADLRAFTAAHPDVNLSDVLPKMREELERTNDLERAWLMYENKRERAERERLEKELKAAKQNADNRRSSPGSQKSAGGEKYGGDEFLAGWYSV